jgi:hypothetical protein
MPGPNAGGAALLVRRPTTSSARASAALPATQPDLTDSVIPPRPLITAIKTDAVGAVSPADDAASAYAFATRPVFKNEDGARIEDGRYASFLEAVTVSAGVAPDRIFQDPLRTFAYATDASFYRLVPKAVIKVRV